MVFLLGTSFKNRVELIFDSNLAPPEEAKTVILLVTSLKNRFGGICEYGSQKSDAQSPKMKKTPLILGAFWNQISSKLDSGAAQFCDHIFEGVKKVIRNEI